MADRTEQDDELSLSDDSNSEVDADSDTDFEDIPDDILDEDAPPAWKQLFTPGDVVFHAEPSSISPQLQIDSSSTPLEILKKFVTDEMIDTTCIESNRLVEQLKSVNPRAFPKWKAVSVPEMWWFLAVNLAMGIVKKPSIKLYWSKNTTLDTPFFGSEMSRNRFEAILASLHLHDKHSMPPNCADRYIKMGTFLKKLTSNFKQAVLPGEFLCLDESLLGYKGRLAFKQFNPMKRSRFGLLFYMLMDCTTGMILDILPYQGKATQLPKPLVDDLGRGGATVAVMMEPYFFKSHKVVTDNFFNSPALAHFLLDRGTFMLCTAQKRRKGMPKMSGKLKTGTVKTYCSGKILLERWMDRREVVMMNTFRPHAMTYSVSKNPRNSRNKPESVLLYNKTMGAVDAMDKIIKPYATLRKTYKWYKKVFFHFIDVAIYNSYQAHRITQTVPSASKYPGYVDFLLNIVETIIAENSATKLSRGRPSAVPKPSIVEYHIPIKKGSSDCVWCKKQHQKRSQTQISCTVCAVRLCLQKGDTSCFSEYHENLKPKKPVNQRQPLSNKTNSLELSGSFVPNVTSTQAGNQVYLDEESNVENMEVSQSLLENT